MRVEIFFCHVNIKDCLFLVHSKTYILNKLLFTAIFQIEPFVLYQSAVIIMRGGEVLVVKGFVRLEIIPINLSGRMTRCVRL